MQLQQLVSPPLDRNTSTIIEYFRSPLARPLVRSPLARCLIPREHAAANGILRLAVLSGALRNLLMVGQRLLLARAGEMVMNKGIRWLGCAEEGYRSRVAPGGHQCSN